MTVEKLIEKLKGFNPKAKVTVEGEEKIYLLPLIKPNIRKGELYERIVQTEEGRKNCYICDIVADD